MAHRPCLMLYVPMFDALYSHEKLWKIAMMLFFGVSPGEARWRCFDVPRWSRTRCAPSATWRMERSCCRSCGTSTRRRPADPRRLAGIGIKNLEKCMGKPWKNQENHVGNAEYYGMVGIFDGIFWESIGEVVGWWSSWFSVANTICEPIRYMSWFCCWFRAKLSHEIVATAVRRYGWFSDVYQPKGYQSPDAPGFGNGWFHTRSDTKPNSEDMQAVICTATCRLLEESYRMSVSDTSKLQGNGWKDILFPATIMGWLDVSSQLQY